MMIGLLHHNGTWPLVNGETWEGQGRRQKTKKVPQ